jgi:hypothetical protein
MDQSKNASRLMLAAGTTLHALALLVLLVSLVKAIYTFALPPNHDVFAALASKIVHAIQWAYAEVAALAPSLAAWLWSSAAPDLDLRQPIWAFEHRALWAVYAMLFVGAAMTGRARARLAQIAAFQDWSARIQLEERLRMQVRQGSVPLATTQVEPETTMPPLKLRWHTTWWGVVALTVGAGLMTEVIKVVVGLAKLP